MYHSKRSKYRVFLEVFFEAVVWTAILLLGYFGIMFVLIFAYDYYYVQIMQQNPFSIILQPYFQQNFFLGFTLCYVVIGLGAVAWRIYRRYRTVQLGYILDELHFISQGNYDHRISSKHLDSMKPVVSSINRLVDSTVEAMEEERRIEQSKDELIVNMSHDIRTPLTSVIGYLGLLESGHYNDEEEMKHYAHIAYTKSLQLQRMVNDLFEYTKISQVNIQLNVMPINVVRMLQQMLVEFEMEAEQAGRELRLDVPEDQEIIVDVDPEQLARVFSNLLTNAFKYGGDGDYVRVAVSQDAKETTFVVENDGDQIPEEALDRLFQRFYRVDSSRSQEKSGSGLGLAIAEGVVFHHHGKIRAESDSQSTRFIFKIPNHYQEERLNG
ncbi:MAG: HAMP domain-containing sensor histidine kinase [Aerococcus sanguinicola]|nr:HAMP domain-containing histidine kinase [Aerococcus sanguinicola]